MKQKIKNIISYFIGNLNSIEKEIPVQSLSVFFSVLIAIYMLRNIEKKSNHMKIKFDNYHDEFKYEIQIIKQRFPNLIEIFSKIETQLRKDLLVYIFDKVKTLFDRIDNDFDDIISWSYQFFKKGLEKNAFKKVLKYKNKIQGLDLLFTTQFFTDKYMVKYLVDKSLASFNKINIEKIVVIDPASGGGNFLTYSLDQLYKLYKKAKPNWTNQKIIDTVLNKSIIGYDLDRNLSDIASLSLFVKACSYAIPSKKTQIKIYGGIENDQSGFLDFDIKSNFIEKMSFKAQLEKLITEKKIKIFLTNPPFMGKRDMDINLKKYLLLNYPQSKGDLCVSFIQRIIQLMQPNDVFGVVSQNNWLYLSSFKEFRKFFIEKQILKECVDLGSNAFEDINGEKTNIALCVIGAPKIKKSRFYNLKYKKLNSKKKLLNQKNIPSELTFELDQNKFLKNSKFEFNYQLKYSFNHIQRLQTYSDFANPMQGTSTGNNSVFVKFVWEVNSNPDWKLVSKGGGFCKWSGLNYYKVLWGKNAEIIKANRGSALRNINRISSTQLVYSDTGTLGLNVRVLKNNQVFIASGPGIQVLKGNKYAHLAFLNSKVATFLLKLINPKFTISAGYIAKLPVIEDILDSKIIAEKSKMCLELKERYLQNKLPTFEFHHRNYMNIKDFDLFIENSILEDIENDYLRLLLESEIEFEIRKQYNFNRKELSELQNIVGESPFFNKNKFRKISTEKLDLLLSLSLNVNCLFKSRALNGYSIGTESILEYLSFNLGVNPTVIFNVIKENIAFFKNTKEKYLKDFLHKIVLSELGVKHTYCYKPINLNVHLLLKTIKSRYPFLKHHLSLTEDFNKILNNHHKNSFFNKPLLSISHDSVVIGQHNG